MNFSHDYTDPNLKDVFSMPKRSGKALIMASFYIQQKMKGLKVLLISPRLYKLERDYYAQFVGDFADE